MKKFFTFLIDLIYIKKCYICSKSEENSFLCSKCISKVEYLPLGVNRIISDKKIYCATEYSGVIQKVIRGIKYHNQKQLAYFQAHIMYMYWKSLKKNDNYVVIPVPLSKERLKKRKYNQIQIVAEEFCKMTGYKLDTNIIRRIKNTKPQYNLTKKERIENLKNAFAIDTTTYNNNPILLLDDVCTSGTTFESIIKELKKHNINNVTCFATSTPVTQ